MSLNMSGRVNDNIAPFLAVARITSWWGSQASNGTGFLVGPNDVLTSAHVVYDSKLGGWATRVEVRFSFNPLEPPSAVYSPAMMRAYTNFDADGDGLLSKGDGRLGSMSDSELDIAILALNSEAGRIFGWFDMTYNFNGGTATLLGYPAFDGGFLNAQTINAFPDSIDNVINYGTRLNWAGASGGPLVVSGESGVFAAGIHSTSAWATSLKGHESFIEGWTRINDAYLTQGLDVFRFFNKKTGHHFFTTNENEALDVFMNLPDFSYESIGFGIRSGNGDTAVYRLYNSTTGRHLYTAFETEMRALDAEPAWQFESIEFNAYRAPAQGRDEIHRFWNSQNGSHLYTANEAEVAHILSHPTLQHFRYEGIAFYTDAIW
jgi:V8-like Glu-specific endopeptidase